MPVMIHQFLDEHVRNALRQVPAVATLIRNKQIVTVFKEAGIIEKYESGIKRVLEAFSEYDLPQPIF